MDRNTRSAQQHRRIGIQRRLRKTRAVDFFNILTSDRMIAATEAHLPEHRERLYPPTVTLSMFMRQTLEEDSSCQKAVNGWAAQRAADGLSPMSVRTGGYCRARQRLPLSMVRALARETAYQLHGQAKSAWRWQARAVLPVHRGRSGGGGWPVQWQRQWRVGAVSRSASLVFASRCDAR